jgi:hypothetical protein
MLRNQIRSMPVLMAKIKGVTLKLLHEEYKGRFPIIITFIQFCHYYQQWKGKKGLSIGQTYKADDRKCYLNCTSAAKVIKLAFYS